MSPPDVRVERSPKRVRVVFGGQTVADTTAARLMWEHPLYPTYYLPAGDTRADLLVNTGETHHSPAGDARVCDVRVGGRAATAAARYYLDSPVGDVAGTIRLDWLAMDAWFEEDEEVYVHPRNPYAQVDVLQSSRHVRVEVDGASA